MAIELPIKAPYHALHLYTANDIDSLMHVASGEGAVFAKALSSIFKLPLDLIQMTEDIAAFARLNEGADVFLHRIGCDAGAVEKALQLTHSVRNVEWCAPRLIPDGPSLSQRPKIAIIGQSGRYPSANDMDKFWDLLHGGCDVHKTVPPLRWDIKSHVDPSGKAKNTSATPFGCWLDDAALFDARFFGISPREAMQIDPAQRLALLTAYEAIEEAGLVPDRTPSTLRNRVGVCYGVTSNDWMETNSAQNIDTYLIPGGNRAFVPGRIAYHFKFSGPNFVVDTACSSSLAAIHIACNMLWRNEADTMIAGGTNIITNPDFTAGLDRGRFLSRTGNCKTFDDMADGYCRGEGVGTMILKRLDDALAEQDPILGVIVNVCTNHSAESASITRPHLGAQCDILRDVLEDVHPDDVSYIEMHGTGTQVGDATELASVLDVFGKRTSPLHIGAVKANVGHGEAAAGVTALSKVLLMMRHDTIPPHCGIKSKINHRFPPDLNARGIYIAHKPVEWKAAKRRVLINNFSAAGGNTTVLLEDAPARDFGVGSRRPIYTTAISAKTFTALQNNAKALQAFIGQHSPDLASLAYTSTARRMHHQYRICINASSQAELARGIIDALDVGSGKRPCTPTKVNFVYTGQGNTYSGMGKALFESIPSFHNDLCRYDQMAQAFGLGFLAWITGDEASTASQLAIVCLEMALTRLWKSWNITPRAVSGHSLGLYAALNAAGVLSEADTIFLVATRIKRLQETCVAHTHQMLCVRESASVVQRYLLGGCEVACINGTHDTVVSGPREDVAQLRERLTADDVKTVLLDIPYAFHSAQVDPMLSHFHQAAQNVSFNEPLIPIICTLTSTIISRRGIIGADYLTRHLREPVNMVGALRGAMEAGLTDNSIFLELGHHIAVSSMLRAMGHTSVSSLKKGQNPWVTISKAVSTLYLAGVDVNWNEYHAESPKHVISLPRYSWDLQEYWIKYEHGWSLRKGEPMPALGPSLLNTSIHQVTLEDVGQVSGTIVVQSDLSRQDLRPIVQGHVVNGMPLCTPVSPSTRLHSFVAK